ncbi:MAG: CCA tRNA nucleotidyltransferase [Candidatus Hadarchaeales archaeon]
MEPFLARVLSRIKPTPAERRRAAAVADDVVERVNRKCAELGVNAEAMLLGSIARGTWLRDEKDIDVFILFPEHLSREELEKQGMGVAKAVAGRSGVERYAEHPYVSMRHRGFDVDLVPCYDVKDPGRIKSAVDRTPHHQRYIQARLTGSMVDEILLTKAFMRGIGVYGAELRIQGFSGYLCELLTLHYGSFRSLVEAGSGWGPETVIDPEKRYADQSEPRLMFRGSPLIVIDPTDQNRNVAAAVSMQSFATFVRACQDFLRVPGERFFFPKKAALMGRSRILRVVRERGTKLIFLVFRSPEVVPDVLYPQLRRTERAILNRLAQEGYQVVRSDVWANSRAVLVFELTDLRLPRMRTRVGPPVPYPGEEFVKEHMGSKNRLAGPFVDRAGRLVFEMKREEGDAIRAIRSAVADSRSLGRNIARSIQEGYEILDERSSGRLLREKGFREFISEYLTRCLPWYR